MTIENLKTEFYQKFPSYSEFCKELVNQITFLLKEKEIKPGFPIEYRVKTLESIIDKIERNNLSISSIEEMKDFAGIRIICLFHSDLSEIEQVLNENLIVHNRENTSDRLNDNAFGYESIHLEASPKEEWFKIPTFKKHEGCKVEIQLRTASQHIWAAVSHTLQYKKESDIPFELRRTINRSAALLETVDLEFERVQNERKKYVSTIATQSTIKHDLNIDTLKYILDNNLPIENRSSDEPYSRLLNELFYFNITNMEQVDQLLKKHKNKLIQMNADVIKEISSKNIKFSGYHHSGFLRHALRLEFKNTAEEFYHDYDFFAT